MSSDMLREVSESLFEFLSEEFPTSQSYTRSDIEQDPMPPLLAHFLGQTLQHRLDVEVEHLRTVRSTWFDYEHPDVQHAYKSFVAALAQYSHIPSEEWRSTLKRATKLVIAHLILPTHTLVEFVFREEDGPLMAPVIYREISYFAAYPYLREAVETFLKKRQLKEIDRTRFSSLLTQVDRHMTANYSVDNWMRMLRPLFDLMRRVPLTRNQGVPIDMLTMFFGDKEAYDIQGRLQVEKEVHRVNTIDEAGLRRVIEGSVGPFEQELKTTDPVQEKKSQPAPPTKPETTPSYLSQADAAKLQPTPAPEPVAPQPEAEDDGQPKPLWEQFQAPEEEREETPVEQTQSDESVPLWMKFQKTGVSSVASSMQAPQAEPVMSPQLKPEAEPTPELPTEEPEMQEAPVDEMPAPPVESIAPPEPVLPPEPVAPAQPVEDRQPAPSHSDSVPFVAPQPEPVSSYANQFAPPPSSPYASQEVPPVFSDAPQYAEPIPELSPLEDLEQSVLGSYGANSRDMFVEHLFGGSSEAYESMLANLKALNSWEEASGVIAEEVFKKHQVNIYSPAAIMFTESIEEQYRQG